MSGSVLLVVLTEVVVAVGLTYVACARWRSRKTRPVARSLIPFLGIAWAFAIHGVMFCNDGSTDPRGLLGFGLVAAIFIGFPVGIIGWIVALIVSFFESRD